MHKLFVRCQPRLLYFPLSCWRTLAHTHSQYYCVLEHLQIHYAMSYTGAQTMNIRRSFLSALLQMCVCTSVCCAHCGHRASAISFIFHLLGYHYFCVCVCVRMAVAFFSLVLLFMVLICVQFFSLSISVFICQCCKNKQPLYSVAYKLYTGTYVVCVAMIVFAYF